MSSDHLVWRKSSRSAEGTDAQCVEVAALPGIVAVRDSKAPEAGHISFSRSGFRALTAKLRQ
ncbi:DUF397 domain-containing protein [Actinomadura fulvescens]|uniref:DUF397 domain-containing protein n=1 Tax=Actinomadura fulvescens TaxID=46160 RepID=A0ABP6CIE8_9ACTN